MSAPPTTTTTTTTPRDPPPSSTTTTTSTTSSSTTTSTTSSTTTSSSSTTSSTTTSTTPTSTSTSTRPSSTSSVVVITSGNVQVTQTVIIQPSFATSAAPTRTSAPDQGFFANKGAVAGTFTAVGVVALIAIVILATTYIRRRRQKQFDREVDEAALEAATAPAPVFLDDDEDPYRSNYSGPSSNAYYQSDAGSHGTYAQSPMTENYGMTEMSNLNRHGSIGPGQIFNPNEAYGAAAAGTAGIGVARTRSIGGPPQDQQGYGLADGNTPYAAFAGPAYNQGSQQQHAQYGGEPYAVASGLQRGPSNASAFNPYGGVAEPVPPLPTSTPVSLNRSASTSQSLVNPHDRQMSPPPLPSSMANPHSPGVNEDFAPPGTTQIAGRVFSGGDFGGGSTPEFGQAPIHAAQTGEQGRWSDYNDEDHVSPSDESAGRHMPVQEESDDEEEEERPKVFKVTN